MLNKSKYQLFMESKIKTPRGLESPKYRSYQALLLENFKKFRFHWLKKGRQVGASTIVAFETLTHMVQKPNERVIVVAPKLANARQFMDKVITAHQHGPFSQIKTTVANSREYRLENGSSIISIAATGDCGCSEACTLLILEEAAYIRNMEEIWIGLYPTLSTGGKLIALSSLASKEDWFYKMYNQAKTMPEQAAYDLGNFTLNLGIDNILDWHLSDEAKLEYGLVD